MRSKSNGELQQELDFLYEAEQAANYRYKGACWTTGIAGVLLAVGIATYGSVWGLLWMPGAVFMFGGAIGIWQERGKTKDIERKIEVIRAVLSDRQR